MSSRFSIPSKSSYERAFEMLVAEINSLRNRIAALEHSKLPAVPTFLSDRQEGEFCGCDPEYTGAHRWNCKFGRGR